MLSKEDGVGWVHLPVGVHEMRSHMKFQYGIVTLLLTDLVQATLFARPVAAKN